MTSRLLATAAVAALLLTGAACSSNDTMTPGGNAESATTQGCPPADGAKERVTSFTEAPPMCIDPAKTYTATMTTDAGEVTIDLDAKKAPTTVNNFVYLARYKFYDGVTFHRVIPGFMIQGGDPEGTGAGGPGYTITDELPEEGAYQEGSLAMANTGAPNSGGSQFFIVTGPAGVNLPAQYTLFGQVTGGMDVVKAIEADGSDGGAPTTVHTIKSVTIAEK
ncbi:peptidylprolyl isomerase [Janibacter sp. GXQ6167]|uniref:peptidylprolyl isomerase n=1 Tax=Janibacter sp. GXQ6167 TaxID=3240791 RepID=UPI0035265758